MSQSNGRTTHTFRVTGFSGYTDSLKKLAVLNPDWRLSPEEIVDNGKAGQKIFKLKFTNRPVQLQPESDNPNAIAVIVAGYQIGYINREESAQVSNILSNCDVQSIACSIWGGQSKVIDEFYGVETQNQGISISVRIVYSDLSIPDDDDFAELLVENEKTTKPAQKKEKAKKKKAKKSIFRRWWFWAIIVVLAVMLFGGNGGSAGQTEVSGNNNVSSGDASGINQSAEVPHATDPEAAPLEASGALGNFDVQIHDYEIANDYHGEPAILIDFSFTNNSEENASVSANLLYMAFQNGVQLEHAYFMDDALYNANDLLKDVQPGSSLDLTVAYSLTSDTAPVEFEISEAFSFNDDKLGKIYEISDGGVTVLSKAPSGNVSGEINGCTVSIVSYKLVKDYEGKNAILFELGFTNNNTDTNNFLSAINFSPFQDGVELETAILMDDYENTGNSILSVKPGAGIPVALAYVLTSDTSPVQIEIGDIWGFSSDKIKTEISIG